MGWSSEKQRKVKEFYQAKKLNTAKLMQQQAENGPIKYYIITIDNQGKKRIIHTSHNTTPTPILIKQLENKLEKKGINHTVKITTDMPDTTPNKYGITQKR